MKKNKHMSKVYTVLLTIALFLSLISPLVLPFNLAQAQGSSGGGCTAEDGISEFNFKCVVDFTSDVINQLILVLIGIAIVLFIWGLIKYITAGGDETKTDEAKHYILFGFIALFVIFSVWGLTNLLVRTFFPDGGNQLFIPKFK